MRDYDDSAPGRTLVLLFDLSGCTSVYDWPARFAPLVKMMTRLRARYVRHLLCTIIVVDSTLMRGVLDGIFTTLYTPARPLKIMMRTEDVAGTVASLWRTERR